MGRTGGFDIVLANPPYVNMVEMDKTAPGYRDLLRSRFETASGGFDLFVPFMERGVALTRPNGMFAFIVPNKVLSAEYASALRRHFSENMTLLSITDLSHVPVFSAAVYPVILIATREPQPTAAVPVEIFGTSDSESDAIEINKLRQAAMSAKTAAKGLWSPLLQGSQSDFVTAAIRRCQTLNDLAVEIAGAATVSEAYEWKNAVIDRGDALVTSSPQRYARFVVSGNVRRFYNTWEDDKVQYIKTGYWHPVLDKNHSSISRRRRTQIESRKIIVSGMSKRPTCVWDDKGIAAGKSTVIVRPKGEVAGEYLAAVINSQTMADIYTAMFGSLSLSGGYLRFGPPQLRELPVPPATPAQQEEIAKMARKCSAARGRDSDRWQDEIDKLVASLYDLCVKAG